jgi:hypothetical protein
MGRIDFEPEAGTFTPSAKRRDFFYGKRQPVFPELYRLYNHC